MKRQELEHIVRAAAGITGEKEFIVLGSQSILGKFPDAPHSQRHSMEVDIYPREHPELAELINGCLGEFSAFHTTFDHYADGVSPTTAILPRGWEDRLVRFSNENTNGAVAHCLDPLDLAYAKLAAGRPKDLNYVVELTRYHFIKPSALSSLRTGRRLGIESRHDRTLAGRSGQKASPRKALYQAARNEDLAEETAGVVRKKERGRFPRA